MYNTFVTTDFVNEDSSMCTPAERRMQKQSNWHGATLHWLYIQYHPFAVTDCRGRECSQRDA